jgi:glycosyltransferase involved in cell wall biosynthesis
MNNIKLAPKVSVIVPVYNVEKYVRQCIESILAQTFTDWELLLVDDGTQDNSGYICDEYAQQDSRIRVFHKKNGGVSSARNLGLENAKGKWITFVDSDDFIYSNVLCLILETIETNALDILQFDYNREEKSIAKQWQLSEIKSGEAYLFDHVLQDWFDKISGPWRQLFSRDFLKTNHLRYIKGVMYEETDYMLHAFLLAERVQHISVNAYHYRVNNESVTRVHVSPIKLAWQVNQMVRCARLINVAESPIAKKTIHEMVVNSFSQLRKEVKNLTLGKKREYIYHLEINNKECRKLVSWRTWLAIRYGITWFVK